MSKKTNAGLCFFINSLASSAEPPSDPNVFRRQRRSPSRSQTPSSERRSSRSPVESRASSVSTVRAENAADATVLEEGEEAAAE